MFDKEIKDALENHEFPFDPKAWEQMSARLDQVMPVQKSNGLPWKSILGVSAIVVTCAAIYFTNGNSTSPVLTANANQSPEKVEIVKPAVTPSTQDIATPSVSNPSLSEKAADVKLERTLENTLVDDKQPINVQPSLVAKTVTKVDEPKNQHTIILPVRKDREDVAALQPRPQKENYSFDIKSTYCENQSIQIDNPYGQPFKIVSESETTQIPVKGSASLKNLKAGSYTIYQGNDKVQTFEVYTVDRNNKVNVVEDYHFVQGVPQISVSPSTQNDIQSWYVNGVKMSGTNYTFNAFNKGDYEVVFKANNGYGCPSEYSTKIHVDQNYNLLAPTAFNVNSMDQRNRTFIPYALTQRDTPFDFIIIEPASGRVVYRSTKAEGWDGIDQGTGELIPANKPYVWKVTLAQPLKGEKKEYSSVVTRVN